MLGQECPPADTARYLVRVQDLDDHSAHDATNVLTKLPSSIKPNNAVFKTCIICAQTCVIGML